MSGGESNVAFIYKKGFRPFAEARQDQEYFNKFAGTGETLNWVDRDGNSVVFN